MSKNTNKKILSLILAMLMILSSLSFAGLTAFAETDDKATEEYLQDMLDMLPTEWYVDLSELEYEQAGEEIEAQAKAIWLENGIDLTDFNFFVDRPSFYVYDGYDIHKADINLSLNGCWLSTEATVIYNNTEAFSSACEQEIKNTNYNTESRRYYEISIDYLISDNYWGDIFQAVEEYHQKLIEDETISVKLDCGFFGGAIKINEFVPDGYFGIFKNGVLYDVRNFDLAYMVPVVTVPASVEEKDINDYVINTLNEIFKQVFDPQPDIISLTKGATITYEYDSEVLWEAEINDGYTIKMTDNDSADDWENYIIIRRETDTEVADIEDVIIADGTDETYVIGSGSGASIHCSYPLDEFVSVSINGDLVDEANYTLTEGSTILTFHSEYLDTLTAGEYEVTLNFVSGSVSTSLTIEEASKEPITEEPGTEEPTTEELPTEEATTEISTTEQTPSTEKATETEKMTAQNTTDKKDTEKSPSTGATNGVFAFVAIALACGAVSVAKKKED